MGVQATWFALIVAYQLSAVFTLSIADTNSTDSTNSTDNPQRNIYDVIFGAQPMRYDDYYDRYRDTLADYYSTALTYYLIALGVFVFGSFLLGAILLFVKRPQPRPGFIVNSNGQTGYNAPVQQAVNPSHPNQKQGYVVNSNGQQSQNVPTQQANPPSYQPMYPVAQPEQKY